MSPLVRSLFNTFENLFKICFISDNATRTCYGNNVWADQSDYRDTQFLDLAVAKSLQSTRTVTDAADDADDVLTTTGYTC